MPGQESSSDGAQPMDGAALDGAGLGEAGLDGAALDEEALDGGPPDGAALGQAFSTAVIMFHGAIGRRLGVSAADHKALGVIQRRGHIASGELAQELHLTPAAVTALVDRLAARDLVEREADPRDRRRTLIRSRATPPVEDVFARLGRRTAEFSRAYSAQDWQAIVRYVRDMTAALEALTQELAEESEAPRREG